MSAHKTTCLIHILNEYKHLKCNIVYSSELYCETSTSIIWLCNQYNCTHKIFNIQTHRTSLLEYARKLQTVNKESCPEVNILFTESCSNPNGYVFDYKVLDDINKFGQKWINIIDNTWLTHIIQNPFEKSNYVNYVVTSLTKYYSEDNAIGGSIISKNDIEQEKIQNIIKVFGLHTSPVNCNIILDAVKNISLRINKASEKTIKILDKLKLLELEISHPYINLTNKYFDNNLYPSVFTVKLIQVEKKEFANIIKKSCRVFLRLSVTLYSN